MIDSIYQDSKENMVKAIAALKKDLKRVRTGRASLSLLDGVKVDYYGTLTPVSQLATLAVPAAMSTSQSDVMGSGASRT